MRWKTGDVPPWKQPFRNSAQAESFRSELVAAARKGEAFRLDDGRPVSWGRQATTTTMSWYAFCVAYVDMNWKHAAAKRRATIAWALVTVMPPMIAANKGEIPRQYAARYGNGDSTPAAAPKLPRTPPPS